MTRRAKGAGSVRTVGKKHRARKRIDGQDVYGPLRSTRLKAEKDLAKLKAPAAVPVGDIPTLREFAETCMKGRYGKKLRLATFETNETIRTSHLNPSKLGKMQVHKITRRDCQEFVDAITIRKLVFDDDGKPKLDNDGERLFEKVPGSPTYVRRIAAYVSRILSLAYRDPDLELDRINPFNGVELPEVYERENRTLSPQEAVRLLNPKTRLEAMILVAMHTGLRRAEVCGLRWVDVRQGFIRVQRSVIRLRDGSLREDLPKSKTSISEVPLTPEAQAALESQARVIVNGKVSPYVFVTEGGSPVDPHNFSRDFRIWKLKNGFPPELRLHDLRGSFVSLLIESGADIRTVQELARHADPRTTMKAYARSRMPVKEEAIERFRGAMLGAAQAK